MQKKQGYGYDAENNRIAVITDGQQTGYVINPQAKLSQLLIKTDAQGKKTYYIYGLGLIGQEEADGTYKTYHFDNRGSITALTDIQGVVTDTFAYAPFGELIQRTGTTDTPFLYNGRDGVMTDSNGLYYMRARYYNPDIKRFINQDVLQGSINNGQSMNRYAYVNGNPVSQVDPFGLCAESTNSNSLIHLILGGLSFIPGLNIGTSLADFSLYFIEGDYVNASIAMACIIPFVKDGVLGVKIADEVVNIGKLAEEAGNAAKNINPFKGSVTDEVIIVDPAGNAMLVKPGQQIQGRPDAKMWQLKDSSGNPTGDRFDGLGHPKQLDPQAQLPHGHRVDDFGNQILDETGNKHLYVYPPSW